MEQENVWLRILIRQGRRDADMSQRELAKHAEVPKSVVADAETGRRAVSWRVARRLLATLGYTVSVYNRAGKEVEDLLVDERRDRRGRQYPPHLDARELSPVELTDRLWFEYRPKPLTEMTYRLDRNRRDLDRYAGWYGEAVFNWLPPHPDRKYIREVLGGDPPLPTRIMPPAEQWLCPGVRTDLDALTPPGAPRRRLPPRPRRPWR